MGVHLVAASQSEGSLCCLSDPSQTCFKSHLICELDSFSTHSNLVFVSASEPLCQVCGRSEHGFSLFLNIHHIQSFVLMLVILRSLLHSLVFLFSSCNSKARQNCFLSCMALSGVLDPLSSRVIKHPQPLKERKYRETVTKKILFHRD